MYPMISTIDNVKDECPDCKAVESKRRELGSRYDSMYYTSQDYDRQKGKGSFKKEFPAAHSLMNDILREKTSLVVNHQMDHAEHEMGESKEQEDLESSEKAAGVPII
jgi:hypothetical protein